MWGTLIVIYVFAALIVSIIGLVKGQDFVETFFLSLLATPFAALFFVLYRDVV